MLDPATGELADRTEALLYAADKAEHVDTRRRAGAARGEVVVTDRYVDSTLAYQGAGRALDDREVERVARWATGDLRPHLTVLLDLEPEHGPDPVRGARPHRGRVARVPPAGARGVPAARRPPTPSTTSSLDARRRSTRSPPPCTRRLAAAARAGRAR